MKDLSNNIVEQLNGCKNRKENIVVLLQDKYFCFMHAIKLYPLLNKLTSSKNLTIFALPKSFFF